MHGHMHVHIIYMPWKDLESELNWDLSAKCMFFVILLVQSFYVCMNEMLLRYFSPAIN